MSKRVIFELSMNRSSWNSRGDIYTVAKTLSEKFMKEKEIIGKSFSYNFGDGWVAYVKVREAKFREKASNKFCGYNWMINSILFHGEILEKEGRN